VHSSDFFQQIVHVDVPWGNRTINVPLFYYDITAIGVAFLTPLDKIRELLPSPRMYPLRVTPWHGLTTINAYAYRDCDLGPYNEVAIGFPVTINKAAPVFSGLLRKLPGIPKVYVHRLPVTTEIARDAGVEFANYPKFLAGIVFESKDGSLACHLAENQHRILTLTVNELSVKPVARSYLHSVTFRDGRILRLELILGERHQGVSRKSAHARLELGDHPIAQELRDLGLGRMLFCQYTPQYQAILSPVLESFAGD
jgi:hypothetical protein